MDQVDHVWLGKARGPISMIAFAFIALIAGALGYLYGGNILGSLAWVALALGGVLAAAGIAGFFLQRPWQVIVASGNGRMTLPVAAKDIPRAQAFTTDLMQARTAFLEGVYQEEE